MDTYKKDLENIDQMIAFFSNKDKYDYVVTLQRAKQAIVPKNNLFCLEHEEEIDEIIESLQREVELFEGNTSSETIKIAPPKVRDNDMLVISLGATGIRFSNYTITKNFWPSAHYLAIDSDRNELKEVKADNSFVYGEAEFGGNSLRGNQAEATKAFRRYKKQIQALIRSSNMRKVLVVLNLSGSMSGIAVPIVKICRELKLTVKVAAFTAFSFEKERYERARTVKANLEKECGEIVLVENDEVFSVCHRTTPMPFALEILNNVMAERLDVQLNKLC